MIIRILNVCKPLIVMDFKYIRNRISEFNKSSLLSILVEHLKKVERADDQRIPLHSILLLIKWTMIYSGQKYPPKFAQIADLDKLLSYIYNLQDNNKYYSFKEKSYFNLCISILAYQQFFLQIPVWKDSFARQTILYNKLHSKYDIERKFFQHANISISDFITSLFFLWLYTRPKALFNNNQYYGDIDFNFIDNLNKYLQNKCAKEFIDLLTISSKAERTKVERFNRIKNHELQTFEISNFVMHPILELENRNVILHRNLLNYTVNYYIYDFLKYYDGNEFTHDFGKAIEDYIKLGLDELQIPYISEKGLKTMMKKDSNVVDFYLEDDVLIECKAIEQKPYPSVYPEKAIITNTYKDSIIKAYSNQMITVANEYKTENIKYGIIITYKETYFGNGSDAWEMFLKEPTKKTLTQNNYSLKSLPPKNLYFIDLATWDKLLMIVKHNKLSIKDILIKAIVNDESPISKKKLFTQHLNEYNSTPVNLEYLNNASKFINQIK